jgi:hypothetical protein
MDPSPSPLRRVLYAVAIAYALVALLAAFGAPLPWAIVHADSLEYARLASNLAEHGVLGFEAHSPSARRELLYPLFLAAFMKLGLVKPFEMAPQNFWPVLVVQAGLYVSALGLLAERARRLVPDAVARTTVVLGAAYLPVAKYSFQVLSESLTIFLVAGFFFLLARRDAPTERARLTLAAVLLGLLGLLKSVMLPAAPLVAAFLLRARAVTRQLAVLFTVVALAFPAAWIARNYVCFDRIILSTTDGASSLYRGNMTLGYQPGGFSDPAIPEEVRAERDRLGLAADRYLVELTRRRLLDSPGEFALHLMYKLVVLWVGEPWSGEGTGLFVLRCLMALLIASRLSLLRRSPDPGAHLVLLFALYQSVLYTLLFTTPRYFAPTIFLLLPVASSTLHHLRLPSWIGRVQRSG